MANFLLGFMVFFTLLAIAVSAVAGVVYVLFWILPFEVGVGLAIALSIAIFFCEDFARFGASLRK